MVTIFWSDNQPCSVASSGGKRAEPARAYQKQQPISFQCVVNTTSAGSRAMCAPAYPCQGIPVTAGLHLVPQPDGVALRIHKLLT